MKTSTPTMLLFPPGFTAEQKQAAFQLVANYGTEKAAGFTQLLEQQKVEIAHMDATFDYSIFAGAKGPLSGPGSFNALDDADDNFYPTAPEFKAISDPASAADMAAWYRGFGGKFVHLPAEAQAYIQEQQAAEHCEARFEDAVDEILLYWTGDIGHTYWNTEVDYCVDLARGCCRPDRVTKARAEIAERFKGSPFRAHISY
jgi:hypothetical protein